MDGWLVIKAERFRESYVKHQLMETTGAEAYLPIVKNAKQGLRPGQAKVEPLFPGYLFARFEHTTQVLQLRRLHGFHSLVCFDGKPAYVDAAVIDDLRRRERGRGYINLRAPRAPLHTHQDVRVIEGPFSGQTGVFVRYLDGTQRVCILLDILRSGVRLELPLDAVAAAPSAHAASVRECLRPDS